MNRIKHWMRPSRAAALAMARRFAGSWLARPSGLAMQCWRHQHGVAAVEFAFVLPVLLTLFYGVVETTRYILIVQKAEKLAHTVADVTAQSTKVTNASLNQLMQATSDIMNPFAMTTNGRVFITSVYRPPGEENAVVNWRYSGGGTLAVTSTLGDIGSAPNMPTGFTFDERENVIASEVFFQFSPLLTSRFFGTTTIYRQAFYKPRFGLLTTAPS